MRICFLLLLLTAASWAQAEERSRGSFLASFTPGGSQITISDPAGRQTAAIDVTAGPDGALLHLSDVAISRDGTLLAAGSWSATNSGFVLLDRQHLPGNPIDTWPFVPARAVSGPDYSAWLCGGSPPELRRYSASGELLETTVLRGELSTPPAYIGASNSRIGLWFAEDSSWFEYDPATRLAVEFSLSFPPGLDSRIILTDANEILGGSGQSMHIFNRARKQWIPAPHILPDPFPAVLLGATGPRLILRTDNRRLVLLPH